MEQVFKGKTAIVTGAAVGIGRAVTHKLLAMGAAVTAADVSEGGLAALKSELKDAGDRLLTCVCDVSDEAQVNETARLSAERFGTADILVNNAALWREGSAFVDTTPEFWHRYIGVNVMGVVMFSRAVLPDMIAKNYGRIVNVASVAGVYGNRNMACYSATKGAVISLTKALAKEVATLNVRVNSVSPGSVSDSSDRDMDASTRTSLSYSGRTGTDNENADLICFLAGDRAAYLNGENIIIDGVRHSL